MAELILHKVSLNEHDSISGEVIFIHGLGGDHLTTWQIKDVPDSFWPTWISQDFKNIRVWSLGYPSAATKWTMSGGDMSLTERASNILEYLGNMEIGKLPLIFIVHSLGGLLVKQILRLSHDFGYNGRWSNIVRNTVGIIFIATPHSGSNLANLGSALRLYRSTKLTNDLKADCPHLRELGMWYSKYADDLGISTKAYYEKEKIGSVLVVNETSADPKVRNCFPIPLDGDHFSVCKPKKKGSLLYLGISNFLEETFPNQRNINPIQENIFQSSGTLKTDKSYIIRQCDKQLFNLLTEKKTIVINGEYQIGKSSLLWRVPKMVKSEWKCIFVDFQGFHTTNKKNFMDEFYRNLHEEWSVATRLPIIADYFKRHPTVIYIDEFGRIKHNIACELIPNLYWLTENSSDNLKIVVCLPLSMQDFLATIRIREKKYYQMWSPIEIEPFTEEETISLLELLPSPVKEVAIAEKENIFILAEHRPQKLQSLCIRLWEAQNNFFTNTQFSTIINDPESYK